MPLNNQWVKEEIKRKVKKYLETNRNGNIPKLVGSQSSSKREVHNNKCLQKATRKVSNLTPQGTRKRR